MSTEVRKQLDYLQDHKKSMTESNGVWAKRLFESYVKDGYLSSRQVEVLESIYKQTLETVGGE